MNEMTQTDRLNKGGYLVGGLVLIALGTLFLLDEFDIASFGSLIRRHWPLIVIAFALPKLLRRETFWSGLWTLTAGVWFQLVVLRVFGLTWRNSWPLMLIALGGGIILRTIMEVAAARARSRHEI
ncbi:MAG TPA: DUF5668 domain-containing protein [Thermoanaerobaculia bacterium]|nr:DUF5668 domain-containing protein [Thermoanaerobaculia bacterium]